MPWWKFWKKDEPVRIEREPPRASPAAAKGKQSIPPAVRENFDEIGETLVAFSSDSDLYFELMYKSEMLRKSGSYHEAYDLARKGVGLLPHLVDDWIKDLEEFNISSIPMLGFCLSYLSIHDRPTDIDEIEIILQSRRELVPWHSGIARAREDVEIFRKALATIRAEPGFVQRDLGKTLGVDGRNVASLMSHAEKAGLVRREQHKNTYRLFVG